MLILLCCLMRYSYGGVARDVGAYVTRMTGSILTCFVWKMGHWIRMQFHLSSKTVWACMDRNTGGALRLAKQSIEKNGLFTLFRADTLLFRVCLFHYCQR